MQGPIGLYEFICDCETISVERISTLLRYEIIN